MLEIRKSTRIHEAPRNLYAKEFVSAFGAKDSMKVIGISFDREKNGRLLDVADITPGKLGHDS